MSDKLQDLASKVIECCICPVSGRMSPFTVQFYDADHIDEGHTTIEIAPMAGELVGGRHDGEPVFDPPFIDLEALRDLFSTEDEQYHFQFIPGNHLNDPHIELGATEVTVEIFFTPQDADNDQSQWFLDMTGPQGQWCMR